MSGASVSVETYLFLATFVFELPFDLKLPDGTTIWGFERESEVEVRDLFVPPKGCPKGLEVDTRMVFRRDALDRNDRLA